jgi:hypothetical protein
MNVCFIYGDFGPFFSLGFAVFAGQVEQLGYKVKKFWWPRDPLPIDKYITTNFPTGPLALIGYSLGGNTVSLVAAGLAPRPIALAVSYDATRNAYLVPLGGNVRRAISYVSTSNIGSSFFFGRARFSPGPGGPEIEVHTVDEDHIGVQGDESLHKITLAALAAAEGK